MVKKFTHLDKQGEVRMVDVTAKAVVEREAAARAVLRVRPETVKAVTSGAVAKGNVTAAAKVAAITAAKNTFMLIPLCHQIRLTHVDVALVMGADMVTIETVVRAVDRTGVEMEALMAASVAALTVYDMCKAVDHTMQISDIHLIEKTKTSIQEGK